MANCYRIQQWEYDIEEDQAADPVDIDFNSLEEANLYWDSNPVPKNHKRTLIIKPNGSTGWISYKHSESKGDPKQDYKDVIEDEYYVSRTLDFNGVDSSVDFGDIYNFNTATEFSGSIWIKIKKFGAMQGVIGKKVGTYGEGWAFGLFPDGMICFIVRGLAGNPGGAALIKGMYTLTDKKWHHFVFTKAATTDANDMNVYKDGKLLNKLVLQNNQSGSSGNKCTLRIGLAHDGSSPMNGSLTQFSLFDRMLTADEVAELYKRKRPFNLNKFSAVKNCLSWWKLGNKDTSEIAYDSIGSFNGKISKATLNSDDLP